MPNKNMSRERGAKDIDVKGEQRWLDKNMLGQRGAGRKSCQEKSCPEEERSRERGIKKNGWHEKQVPREGGGKSKRQQKPEVPGDRGVKRLFSFNAQGGLALILSTHSAFCPISSWSLKLPACLGTMLNAKRSPFFSLAFSGVCAFGARCVGVCVCFFLSPFAFPVLCPGYVICHFIPIFISLPSSFHRPCCGRMRVRVPCW